MRLKEKVVIITGAGSGFGRASAVLFAKEGAKVVVTDIVDDMGNETVNQIKADGEEAIYLHMDVTDASDVKQVIKTTVETYGKLDILFNNAGNPGKVCPIEDMDESLWDLVHAVNTKAIYLGAKYAVPEMKKQGGGVILNTASVSADRPRPQFSAYTSSKGAAVVLTKSLAIELATYNIRVNCINPVAANTPMLTSFTPAAADQNESIKLLKGTVPMGRLAEPEDVAYAALFLASDEASLITGVALRVDGGRGI